MRIELIFTFLTILISLFISSNATPLNLHRRQSLDCTNVVSDYMKTLDPLPPTNGPVTRCYHLELKVIDLAPDGFTRPVWSVNGQYPAPIIQANYGDRLIINVTNNFGYPALIHWHGMFQRLTNYFDGIGGVTQCPIPERVSFIYNFTLEQDGTYWYHSHVQGQLIDGLKGALVIHNPNDPYLGKYDYEYVMTLSDWYHTPTGILLPLFRDPTYKGFDPIPDSGDISGIGQYDCNAAPKNSTCKSNNKVATYTVKKGKKYRIRIINTSSLVHFIFSIDEHPLTIIEVDGELIKPVTLNTLPINIAERYSVIIDANQPIDNYQIRATMVICTPISNTTINYNALSTLNYNIMGILKYEGAEDKSPTSKAYTSSTSEACRDVNVKLLKPYYQRELPKNIIKNIDILVNFGHLPNTGTQVALLNNKTFVPNLNYPTNQRILEGTNPYTLPDYDNAYVYDCNSTKEGCADAYKNGVDINIINNTTDSHPFHLHGHNFYVIYNGENQTGIGKPDKSSFNLIDPPLRDVTTVLPNSTTVIRYFANNTGVWFFHCHIQWHLNMGMAAQMIENPSLFTKDVVIPSAVDSLCVQDNNSGGKNVKKNVKKNIKKAL